MENTAVSSVASTSLQPEAEESSEVVEEVGVEGSNASCPLPFYRVPVRMGGPAGRVQWVSTYLLRLTPEFHEKLLDEREQADPDVKERPKPQKGPREPEAGAPEAALRPSEQDPGPDFSTPVAHPREAPLPSSELDSDAQVRIPVANPWEAALPSSDPDFGPDF